MTKREIIEKVESMGQLPTLPSVITSVLELIRNPKTSAADIGRAINVDMALSTKILKIVNSAFYGFPKKIGTVTQAVVILGFNTIKSAILGVSVIKAFEDSYQKSNKSSFHEDEFWEHSIGCASVCRVIAKRMNIRFVEEAFISGMLHDIGKLIFDQFVHDEFKKSLQLMNGNDIFLNEAEKEVFKFDHADIGAFLLEKWNFPADLCNAVQHHHHPGNLKKGEDKILSSIVHLGDIICKAVDIGNNGDKYIHKIDSDVWSSLELQDDFDALFNDINEEFKKASNFLEIINK